MTTKGTVLYFGPWYLAFQRPHHLMKALQADGWGIEVFAGDISRRSLKRNLHRWPESAAIPRCSHSFVRPFSSHNALLKWINPLVVGYQESNWMRKVHLPRPLVLFFGFPEHLRWIDHLNPEAVVFDVLDDYEDFPGIRGTAKADTIRKDFQTLLHRADLVTVTSRALMDKVRESAGHPILLPNGCDPAHFAKADVATPNARVIYYGALENWVDRELLLDTAALLPGVTFDLYGPKGPAVDGPLPPNVIWHGPVPYQQLPGELRHAGVATIPFRIDNPLIKATNPIKYYEYLAAGLPIVATSMPELQPHANPRHLVLADSPGDFAQAIERFLREEQDPAERSRRVAERRALGARCSWDERGRVLAGALRAALDGRTAD